MNRSMLLGLVALSMLATSVRADPPADLEVRLKALEEQNAKLQKQLEELLAQKKSDAPVTAPVQIEVPPLPPAPPPLPALPAAFSIPSADEGTVVGSDTNLKIKWDNGFWAETADKAFRIHFGGRAQFDNVWMTAPENVMFGGPSPTGSISDAVAFRRGRLAVEGTLWESIQFNFEFDFFNTFNDTPAFATAPARQTVDTPVPTDFYVQFDNLPFDLGHLKIGNQKDPISFEHLTSSRFLNFMERSLAFDSFEGGLNNGFVPGIVLFNSIFEKRLHYAVGITKNNQSVFGFNVGDNETVYTGRLTGLPVWEQDGRVLVHVGLGYQFRNLDDNVQRVRSRTGLRNGPLALHTILSDFFLTGDHQQLIVPELVVLAGPWTLQAEYYGSWTTNAKPAGSTGPPVGTAFYQGWYAELLYMFTGENRVYDRDFPRLTRVSPYENFFLAPDDHGGRLWGSGAWQLGMRYQHLDLDSLGLGANRGSLHEVTVGLNWFLNPNMKLQFNYMWNRRTVADSAANSGDIRGFGIRLATDW